MTPLQSLVVDVLSSDLPHKEQLREILEAVEEFARFSKGPRSRENDARDRILSAVSALRR